MTDNNDYTYTLYQSCEDAPYFYKDVFSYSELIKTLNEIAEDYSNLEEAITLNFLDSTPEDWGYVRHGNCYIERLPKNVAATVWKPIVKQKF